MGSAIYRGMRGNEKHRPIGVVLLAVYTGGNGIFNLFMDLEMHSYRWTEVLTVSKVAWEVITIALCYGFWTLQEWARKPWLLLSLWECAAAFFVMMADETDAVRWGLPPGILSVVRLFIMGHFFITIVGWFYLTRPYVKQAFGKG